MSDRETLAILEVHRVNLAGSKTFEEYRYHHVAYVDCVIERVKADIANNEAMVKFVYRAAATDKISGDEGKAPTEQTK